MPRAARRRQPPRVRSATVFESSSEVPSFRRNTLPERSRRSAPERRSCAARVEDELRAAKESDRAIPARIAHHRVPELRRAAQVHGLRDAGDLPLAGGAEKIGLEL